MATHKAAGSSKNNRESHSKRLGQKLSDGQYTKAGQIIFRQRGTKIHPGDNVGRGTDDTLFAKMSGYVKYSRLGKDRKQVSVYVKYKTKRNRKFASVYSEKTITKSNKQK